MVTQTLPLSVGVLVMSFFTLSGDIILIILGELDPLSLFHFCLVCGRRSVYIDT